MKNSGNKFLIGLGIILILCGVYWIYKDGELLEIILPFILGIGAIASAYSGIGKKNRDND